MPWWAWVSVAWTILCILWLALFTALAIRDRRYRHRHPVKALFRDVPLVRVVEP